MLDAGKGTHEDGLILERSDEGEGAEVETTQGSLESGRKYWLRKRYSLGTVALEREGEGGHLDFIEGLGGLQFVTIIVRYQQGHCQTLKHRRR